MARAILRLIEKGGRYPSFDLRETQHENGTYGSLPPCATTAGGAGLSGRSSSLP
jgi:hypothetical protein